MNSKIQNLFSKYGRIGLSVYFIIFFITLLGFWALLTAGFVIRSWSFFSELGDIGAIGLAYAATKITQPICIALTLLITPLIDKIMSTKQVE